MVGTICPPVRANPTGSIRRGRIPGGTRPSAPRLRQGWRGAANPCKYGAVGSRIEQILLVGTAPSASEKRLAGTSPNRPARTSLDGGGDGCETFSRQHRPPVRANPAGSIRTRGGHPVVPPAPAARPVNSVPWLLTLVLWLIRYSSARMGILGGSGISGRNGRRWCCFSGISVD